MVLNTNVMSSLKEEEAGNSKPKFPLTAYNLFLQIIRQRILDCTDSLQLPITPEEAEQVAAGYREKPLKRRHRKTDGMIGFKGLSREASRRWKYLDKETRKMLEDKAAVEKRDYLIQLKAYTEREEAWKSKLQLLQQQQALQQTQQHEQQQSSLLVRMQHRQQARCFLGLQNTFQPFMQNEHQEQQKLVAQQTMQLTALLYQMEQDCSIVNDNDANPLEPTPLPLSSQSLSPFSMKSGAGPLSTPGPLETALPSIVATPRDNNSHYYDMEPIPIFSFQLSSTRQLLRSGNNNTRGDDFLDPSILDNVDDMFLTF